MLLILPSYLLLPLVQSTATFSIKQILHSCEEDPLLP